MSTQSGKDVIYIDIDDEITAIIDKVRGADQRIVALVLPKRATVLQSMVNMKLLKRTADSAKKHLVLITGETGLLPLAGAAGVYVAKTLQSKPEIPPAHNIDGHDIDDVEESVDMNTAVDDPKLDKNKAIGEYSSAAAGATVSPTAFGAADDEAPIELDNASPDGPTGDAGGKKSKPKKDKKLAIPDFNKFRLWAVLGAVGLVVIIFLFYIALGVMPRATISVKTDSSAIDTNLDLTLDTEADTVDVDEDVVPAKSQQSQKTASQQVASTGQKDNGQKASGQVTLSLKDCSKASVTIPAGTGVTAKGLTFITQQSTTLSSVQIGPQCRNSQFPDFSSDTVDVVAQQAGDKFNIDATAYAVAGISNVSGTGTAMTGGTSEIIKIVTQNDIDSAKQKINEQAGDTVKDELKEALESQGLFAVEASFTSGEPEVTSTAGVGDEADNVTVTTKTTYAMVAVKESDLKKVIANAVNKEIDPTKQNILDYGLDSAVFKLLNSQNNNTMVTLQATAIAGSDLDLTAIKKQVAGKKAANAKEIISQYPGVTDVDVKYSPFWVSSIPKKTSKITISVEKPVVKDAN